MNNQRNNGYNASPFTFERTSYRLQPLMNLAAMRQ